MNDVSINGYWLGVDVGKFALVAAIAPAATVVGSRDRLATESFPATAEGVDALTRWTGERCAGPCLGVCMESTGAYSRSAAALLRAAGFPVASIVNPVRPLHFAGSLGVRDKTDRGDAAVLALYGLIHRPPANAEPPVEFARLRDLWRLREDFVGERLRVRARIEQARDPFVLAELARMLQAVEEAIKRVAKEIAAWIEKHSGLSRDFKLMTSVPGVGPVTAGMILAELGDLRDWKRDQLVGFAGLFPKRHESGTSVHRKPRLARGGGRRLRACLYMAAMASLRSARGDLVAFRDRLLGNGKSKMASLCAVMRKLLLLVRSVVVRGTPYSQLPPDSDAPSPESTPIPA